MVALEPNKTLAEGDDNQYVSLMIQYEKAEYMLCSLKYGSVMQVPLDLNFTEGEELALFINGKGVVHLSGYLNPDEPGYPELDSDSEGDLKYDGQEQDSDEDDSEDIEDSEDDSDEDSEEEGVVPQLLDLEAEEASDTDEEETPIKGKRKKKQLTKKDAKKKAPATEDDEDEEESDMEADESVGQDELEALKADADKSANASMLDSSVDEPKSAKKKKNKKSKKLQESPSSDAKESKESEKLNGQTETSSAET